MRLLLVKSDTSTWADMCSPHKYVHRSACASMRTSTCTSTRASTCGSMCTAAWRAGHSPVGIRRLDLPGHLDPRTTTADGVLQIWGGSHCEYYLEYCEYYFEYCEYYFQYHCEYHNLDAEGPLHCATPPPPSTSISKNGHIRSAISSILVADTDLFLTVHISYQSDGNTLFLFATHLHYTLMYVPNLPPNILSPLSDYRPS